MCALQDDEEEMSFVFQSQHTAHVLCLVSYPEVVGMICQEQILWKFNCLFPQKHMCKYSSFLLPVLSDGLRLLYDIPFCVLSVRSTPNRILTTNKKQQVENLFWLSPLSVLISVCSVSVQCCCTRLSFLFCELLLLTEVRTSCFHDIGYYHICIH